MDKNLAAGYPAAEKGLFNVGLLHTSLDGREGHAVYAPCGLDDLRSKGYQYWALGHIHKQEIVSEDPLVVFSGCIQGRHIRETGSKGCMLVYVEDGGITDVEKTALDVLRWIRCTVDLTDVSDLQEVLARTRKSIEDQRAAAEGRLIALRIRYEGATAISQELFAYPERFEQQIRALGAEIGGDDLWVERIENAVTGKLDLNSVLTEDSTLATLLAEILATPDNPDEIARLKDVLELLRQKIPPDVFGADSILNLDDPQTIVRLVDEAKHMLIGRLLTVGGE